MVWSSTLRVALPPPVYGGGLLEGGGGSFVTFPSWALVGF